MEKFGFFNQEYGPYSVCLGYYDNLVTKMRVKEQEIEVETKKIENSEINKLKSEIEGFKIVKTEHEKKTNEVASGYNKVTK